ncbi:UDP-3-O-acylglucosamine N-acyltransferase [Marinobacterium sp. xm-m-312]|nr:MULTISPECIES: UDP-3-O-(3-hydroxymyristoyl)glucosamine N-acyltransferase [unclassified Marinobacterium]NRP46913.1 UDP-3-O-acylglucosamine N-acyltransferase [Marinobacterium sp. xm-d-543]NRQ23122.1 UDP-3-O-acylglucosamine N-acyltransferase [Marinobacterium sp. xm-m-312]
MPKSDWGLTDFSEKASDLALRVGGELVGSDCLISGMSTLDKAGAGQLSFLSNAKYQKQLPDTQAEAVLVSEEFVDLVPNSAIVVANPYLAFAKLSQLFDWRGPLVSGIAPTAKVDPSAEIDPSAQIAEGAIIGAQVKVAAHAYVGPNVVIGEGVLVGESTRLEANVTLYPGVSIGKRCIIHSGAVIGADGFGFAHDGQGWVKIAQAGGVILGDDVEVGANTTIDRGALSDTLIANGVKLDNQIQIAHNVEIGESTAIAGCTAIAGSTRIGSHCTIAGMSGVTGHLEIADRTHITAMTLVSKSIKESGAYSSGTGVEPHAQWKRNVVRFKQLDELSQRVKNLEKLVKKLAE